MSARLLARTRDALGPAPRIITRWDSVAVPSWMRGDNPLLREIEDTRDIIRSGDVVWGHLVQANSLLFRPGKADCPAALVHATGKDDVPIEALERAARAVFMLKGTKPYDGNLARVAAWVSDETTVNPPLLLPLGLSWGIPMRVAPVFVHRAHLPSGVLACHQLPIVVSPDRTRVVLLPARLWADDLRAAWFDLAV